MIEYFEKAATYRVFLIGDAIHDEYCYVEALGKASKEPIVATREIRWEKFQGGVLAAAEHLKDFVASVNVRTGAETTIKQRYVEPTYTRKLFEVHKAEPSEYDLWHSGENDMVIVTDFGHGCITAEVIKELTQRASFLAVNAQTNSGNFGFNLITKYPRADFVVIDEAEARLAAHDRESPLMQIVPALGFQRIIITQGPQGSLGYEDGIFIHEPSYATRITDTMGAGDAFFCVTAPLARAGMPMDMLLKVGNAAAALKLAHVGQHPVRKDELLALLAARRSGR